MTLSIGNNLIAKPALPSKGDSVKTTITQPENPSNDTAQQITVESNKSQTLSANVFGNLGLVVEGDLHGQGLGQNTTEGIAETLDPSEILDWTDDVPPVETEFEEVPIDINEKVDSINSDPNGADDQDTSDEESGYDEFESTDGKQEEELAFSS